MKKKNEIPKLKSIWKDKSKDELRELVYDYVKTHLKGMKVINQDLEIKVIISVKGGRKTSHGGAMYHKKAESIRALPEIIKIAKYNNFGQRKDTDSKAVIGYFNFKSKFYLDDVLEHIHLTVRLQKDGKFHYNLEINNLEITKKENTPQSSI